MPLVLDRTVTCPICYEAGKPTIVKNQVEMKNTGQGLKAVVKVRCGYCGATFDMESES